MRFHRNAGARGMAEWTCATDDQSRIWCYSRVALVKTVTFQHNGADGWAIGELLWLSEAMPHSRDQLWLPDEVRSKVRPDILKGLPVEGWEPLRFVRAKGFESRGAWLLGARWMLLGPGLAVVRGKSERRP